MKSSALLKSVAVAALLGGASLFTTGCARTGLEGDPLAPPAYSSFENAQREWRYAAFDWSQAIDDIDQDVTMTRPSSIMTKWNIHQSD